MLETHIDQFLIICTNRQLAPKTVTNYEHTLRLMQQYFESSGITDEKKIKNAQIQQYLQYMKERGKYTVAVNQNSRRSNTPDNRHDKGKDIQATTINGALKDMRVFFNWLVTENIISESPIKKTDFMEVKRKPLEFVTDDEYQKLIQSLDIVAFSQVRDSVIIQLLLDTGMRIGECLQLKDENIDLSNNTFFIPEDVTKSKKARYVFFGTKMAKQLRRWFNFRDRHRDTEYLFCTNCGNKVTVNNFEVNIRKYCNNIGIERVHPHNFRNNFAKRFLMNGGDIYTLSRILGHSSVKITEQAYLDITEKDLQKMYQNFSPLNRMKTYRKLQLQFATIKNYKEMCILLDEKVTNGTAKTSQLKEWQRYFGYHKQSNAFIIDEVYDTPLPPAFRIDDVYSKYMQVLLCDYLLKTEKNHATLPKSRWYEVCGMVNYKYNDEIQKETYLEKYKAANKLNEKQAFYQLNAFDSRVRERINNIFYKSLNRLKKNGYIIYNDVYSIVEVIDGKRIEREADNDEIAYILEAQKNIKKEMVIVVISNYNIKQYYSMLNDYLKNAFGWVGCWHSVCIIIANNYAKIAYEESLKLLAEEIQNNKYCVNQNIVQLFVKAINGEYEKNQVAMPPYFFSISITSKILSSTLNFTSNPAKTMPYVRFGSDW